MVRRAENTMYYWWWVVDDCGTRDIFSCFSQRLRVHRTSKFPSCLTPKLLLEALESRQLQRQRRNIHMPARPSFYSA